mgnify:CR=1 FL=1
MVPHWKKQQALCAAAFTKALATAGSLEDDDGDYDLDAHIDRRIEALEMNASQKTYTLMGGCLAPGRCKPPFCCEACAAALPPRTRRVLRRKKVFVDDLTPADAEQILKQLNAMKGIP